MICPSLMQLNVEKSAFSITGLPSLNLTQLCTFIDNVATFTVINIFFKMSVYNIGKLLHKRILKQQCDSLSANTYLNMSHMVPKMMTENYWSGGNLEASSVRWMLVWDIENPIQSKNVELIRAGILFSGSLVLHRMNNKG